MQCRQHLLPTVGQRWITSKWNRDNQSLFPTKAIHMPYKDGTPFLLWYPGNALSEVAGSIVAWFQFCPLFQTWPYPFFRTALQESIKLSLNTLWTRSFKNPASLYTILVSGFAATNSNQRVPSKIVYYYTCATSNILIYILIYTDILIY